MTSTESVLCRSLPWRAFTRRVVLPWGLQGFRPSGDVLEIGAGSGAMAAEVLRAHPAVRMTATDVDPTMVESIRRGLAAYGDRSTAQKADATSLPFGDASFDAVLSWIMLHHTIEWEQALSEIVRVLRPRGWFVGYDLLATAPRLHRHDHSGEHAHVRTMSIDEFSAAVAALPVDQSHITRGLGGLVVKFKLRKAA
jgi:ubiquinone/menaquinone biosynthesis C-methylase UbiE